jgi:hypothetical protein
MRVLSLAAVALAACLVSAPSAEQANPFLGAWNITGTAQDSAIIYWLEVKQEAGGLTGMFLNRVGNPNPLGIVRVEGDELVFRMGTAERPSGPEYRAKVENGRLIGRHTVTEGGGRGRGRGADPNAPPPPPPTERTVNWIGVRPPEFPDANANAAHRYEAPVELFDGKSLDMWTTQFPNRPFGWKIEDGAMTNDHPADTPAARNNLISKQKFMNFKLEVEYKLGPNSNSGIYIRGRYELQLLDDFIKSGRADLGHMAIYGRTAPSVKASKPAGEWQTMTAIIHGNRATVTLNGQRVHDNQVILGVTGGTLDADEATPGPLMVQGDHSVVWIRKLTVTPIR